MGRGNPCDCHVEIAFIHRQGAFQNAGRNWPGDTATMFAALHHHGDDVLGIIERSEASKPRDRIFVAAICGLRGAGFTCHLHGF